MPNPSEEDLFKDSTMTFGEHLDELRSALFKSVIALVIGCTIGFVWLGNWVVQRIQDPLIAEMENYQIARANADFAYRIESLERAKAPIPAQMRDPEYIRQLALGERMLFEEQFLDPQQLMLGLKEKFPEHFKDAELPETPPAGELKKSDLIRMFVWHLATDDNRVKVKALNAQEPFMIKIKASILAGIVLASPAIFYFIWNFVAAGLYPQEKKYVHIFLPFSLGLFLAGALSAFFFVFPPMLKFFFSYSQALDIEIEPRISEWLDLALMLPVAFGASFQLPLVMLFLNRIGIFSIANYLASWRMAILVMAIVAMVVTPTGDPGTMLMMLIPLTFLYFGGILLCKWMPARKPSPRG